MKKLFLLITLITAFAAAGSAQIVVPVKKGATLPATCSTTDPQTMLFAKTGSSNGLYYCSATNTWSPTGYLGALTSATAAATISGSPPVITVVSAPKLTTARTIGGVSFDGTGNITVATATGGFAVSGGALNSSGDVNIGGTGNSTSTNLVTASATGIANHSLLVNGVVAANFGANVSGSSDAYGIPTGTVGVGVAQGYPLVFTTSAAERMRISSAGAVTIGGLVTSTTGFSGPGTSLTGTASGLTAGSATTATTATNLAGGSGGRIPYQSAAGTTAMLANGTAGQVLQSNGTTAAPSWITPTGGGNAQTANPLSQFAATTSSQFSGVISDETGTGAVVLATSPTLTTPALGTPTALVCTNCTGTASGLTAGNVTTNANLTGDVTSSGNATTVGKVNGVSFAGLATGILKNTTTTGVPSIAVAADFPTLNQNTTGSAATLTTPRTINGTSFDGSANVTVTAAAGTLTGGTLSSGVTASSLTSFGTSPTANNFVQGYTSTVTANGTTALTVSSNRFQVFTGTTTQTVTLPAVSGLALGHQFEIWNLSTGNVVVQSSAGATIVSLQTNDHAVVASNATSGTGATVWDYQAIPYKFTSSSVFSAGVIRDSGGNFSAGTITAALSGNAATATTLQTARSIYGNNFDGSAALSGVIASTYGGTGNGFTKFSGPSSSEKTFTLPNASATVLTDNAAVTVAQGGTGAATLTGILKGNGTSVVTTVTAPSGTIVGTTDTQTLTNKRLNSRVCTTTSTSSLTIDSDSCDSQTVTALAANMTVNAPTGTPVDGQRIVLRILDNGTSWTLTFTTGSTGAFRFSSDLPAPSTTTISKTFYMIFVYNSAASRWDDLSQLGNF